jgi:TfoX/Sxy family transcriptional regulator of competence genes
MSTTSKETVERIAALLGKAGTVRTRSMMDGYLVYLDETLIGQINNDVLHIKITPSGEKYATHFTQVEPYPGAKLAFQIPEKLLEEADWFVEFLVATRDQLKKAQPSDSAV